LLQLLLLLMLLAPLAELMSNDVICWPITFSAARTTSFGRHHGKARF